MAMLEGHEADSSVLCVARYVSTCFGIACALLCAPVFVTLYRVPERPRQNPLFGTQKGRAPKSGFQLRLLPVTGDGHTLFRVRLPRHDQDYPGMFFCRS